MNRQRRIRLTDLQERAMWSMLRLGTVSAHMPVDDADPPWIVVSTIRALHAKGLVRMEERGRMRVMSPDRRQFQSPLLWEATLTRAGEEWLADKTAEIEGLPTNPSGVTV